MSNLKSGFLNEEVAMVFVFDELTVSTRHAVACVTEQLELFARMLRAHQLARFRCAQWQRQLRWCTVFRFYRVFFGYLHSPAQIFKVWNYFSHILLSCIWRNLTCGRRRKHRTRTLDIQHKKKSTRPSPRNLPKQFKSLFIFNTSGKSF